MTEKKEVSQATLEKKIKFNPIPGTKENVGIYRKDLDKLGGKEGDWVGIRYGQKEISNSVRVVEQENGWKDRLIWVSKEDAKSLELEKNISGLSPESPNEKLGVTVWKHTLPRDKKLYFAIFSTIIAILTAVFTAMAQTDFYPDYKIILGATALVLTIVTILSTTVVTVMLKQ